MVRSKEEIMGSLKNILGDNTSDEALVLLEDVNDTLSVDNESIKAEMESWKNKYEENDAEWRKKYRDRFYGDVDDTEERIFQEEYVEEKPLTFENLFTEV